MKTPETPENEESRLSRLHSLGLIYSPAEERFDRITRLARQVFEVPIALVSLVTAKCQWFKSSQGLATRETSREISFCGHAILDDGLMVIPDTLLDPDFADNPLVTGEPYIRFYAGQPLVFEGMKLGTLCIIDRKPRQLSPSEVDTMRSMAVWAQNEFKVSVLSQAQIDLISELDEARRQAMVDPLTNVWNRRGMDELLKREFLQAERDGVSVALMIIDIDNFKEINDSHGHSVGDLILKEVAQRIRSSVRPQDTIGRIGGDEFMVFLGDCTKKTIETIAQRTLIRINGEPIAEDEFKVKVTLSIGVVLIDNVTDVDIQQIFVIADKALFEAKSAGRNQASINTFP